MGLIIIIWIVIAIIGLLICIAYYAISSESTQSYQYNSSLTDEENLNNISKITTYSQFNETIKEYTNNAQTLYEFLIEDNQEPNHPLEEEALLFLMKTEEGIKKIKAYYEEVVSLRSLNIEVFNEYVDWANFLRQVDKRFSARWYYLKNNKKDTNVDAILALNRFTDILNLATKELTIFRNRLNSLEAEATRIEKLLNNKTN